jgi:myo-inositol 2-dehydrogenase / D-chiro-inositol 1-dehydrogenase
MSYDVSRRQFIGGTIATAASAALLAKASGAAAKDAPPQRKIKLGWVGCGGRGQYLIPFFEKHGGYELHAVADYRPDGVERFGNKHNVDKSRRFCGLSGYKKVIESGAEAIVLEVPPCFFPEQASAAVAAGLHVYMAKPVAVDVPGCLQIEAAGKLATEKNRVFLVDYQLPLHPANVKVADLWRKEKTVKMTTVGVGGSRPDLPRGKTIEPWLYHSVWDNHIAMGGGFIVSYDIHAIDAAVWLLGQRPVSAIGEASLNRPNPYSDSPDVISVVYRYADGLVHEHTGMGLANGTPGELRCRVYSPTARATVGYENKVFYQRRGQDAVADTIDHKYMYDMGPVQNVADFYTGVTEGHYENPTVRRAVDGCLTCILGREAALRRTRVTMDELLAENKRLDLDLTGLRA